VLCFSSGDAVCVVLLCFVFSVAAAAAAAASLWLQRCVAYIDMMSIDIFTMATVADRRRTYCIHYTLT